MICFRGALHEHFVAALGWHFCWSFCWTCVTREVEVEASGGTIGKSSILCLLTMRVKLTNISLIEGRTPGDVGGVSRTAVALMLARGAQESLKLGPGAVPLLHHQRGPIHRSWSQ